MSLKLENVVPWGRSFNEYMRMFGLTLEDLKASILDCASGPASFNAEAGKASKVISCDPIYRFTASEIEQRIQKTYPVIMDATRANKEKFVWQDIKSLAMGTNSLYVSSAAFL